MTRQLAYGTVRDHPRKVIHVVRVLDDLLDYAEIDQLAAQMRTHVTSRHGVQTPNVVVVQGDTKETLRLFGDSHAVGLVRAALFNAAIAWSPLQLDEYG
jgi:hypothetical protein